MPSPVQQVLFLLPKLTSAERKLVVDRATLLGVGVARQRDALDDVWPFVLAAAPHLPPLTVIRKVKLAPSLQRGAGQVIEFICTLGSLSFDRDNRRKLIAASVRAVVDGMREHRIPVLLTTLGPALQSVGQYVEEAYPGYIESGLLLEVIGRDRT